LLQAEDDIRAFLIRYPADSRAGRVREYEGEINLYRLQRRFDQRVKGLAGTEDLLPVERAYLEAINYVRLDPARGMAKLQSLVDLYDHSGRDTGPTGQCITLALRRLTQLQKEIDEHAGAERALLDNRLDAADAMRVSEPRRAQAMYQAVIELYGHKPWAADAVRRARASLEKKPSSRP
jgi:hypothetical protein